MTTFSPLWSHLKYMWLNFDPMNFYIKMPSIIFNSEWSQDIKPKRILIFFFFLRNWKFKTKMATSYVGFCFNRKYFLLCVWQGFSSTGSCYTVDFSLNLKLFTQRGTVIWLLPVMENNIQAIKYHRGVSGLRIKQKSWGKKTYQSTHKTGT